MDISDSAKKEGFFINREHGLSINFRGIKNNQIYSDGVFIKDLKYAQFCVVKIKKESIPYNTFIGRIPENIYDSIEARNNLRINKQFDEADKIKISLNKYGIVVEDLKECRSRIKINNSITTAKAKG